MEYFVYEKRAKWQGRMRQDGALGTGLFSYLKRICNAQIIAMSSKQLSERSCFRTIETRSRFRRSLPVTGANVNISMWPSGAGRKPRSTR